MWLPLQDTKEVAHNNNAADTLVFCLVFFCPGHTYFT